MRYFGVKRHTDAAIDIAIALCFVLIGAVASAQQPKKQSTRVLFVESTKAFYDKTRDGSVRGDQFRRFLNENFSLVKTCRDKDFSPAVADDVDVIVVDGNITGRVPGDFDRPIVLLGANLDTIEAAVQMGRKLEGL